MEDRGKEESVIILQSAPGSQRHSYVIEKSAKEEKRRKNKEGLPQVEDYQQSIFKLAKILIALKYYFHFSGPWLHSIL